MHDPNCPCPAHGAPIMARTTRSSAEDMRLKQNLGERKVKCWRLVGWNKPDQSWVKLNTGWSCKG